MCISNEYGCMSAAEVENLARIYLNLLKACSCNNKLFSF